MDRRKLLTLGSLLLMAPLMACARGPAYGAPPLRPAPNFSYLHPSGVTLIYDDGLGVYLVSGWPSYYFYDGLFYNPIGVTWYVSVAHDGPWRPAQTGRVPPGLRARQSNQPPQPGRRPGRR